MMLLVDIGNTRIKWAFWTQSETLCSVAAVHRGVALEPLLSEIWGGIATPPKTVVVSNVAGAPITENLKKWIKEHWNVPVRFLTATRICSNLKNGYQKPTTLGVDRWCAMIGARQYNSGAFCVMDCGSAITLDAVTAKGEHLGGLILPGFSRLQTVLLDDYPQLSALVTAAPPLYTKSFLAKNTSAAIQVGAVFMAVATLERILEELHQQLSETVTPILTGGDAPQILRYLPMACQHRPDLVLEGMCMIASNSAEFT